MKKNKYIFIINKIRAYLKLSACSIILLWLGHFFTIPILVSQLPFAAGKLFYIVEGIWLTIGIFWQIRIIQLLWRKNAFIAQCSHSQHKVKYKNAIDGIEYPCNLPYPRSAFFASSDIPVMIVTIMVLLFPIPKVGCCPTCDEIKVQCPYCKHIMPIEEIETNHFKCVNCGKTNHII